MITRTINITKIPMSAEWSLPPGANHGTALRSEVYIKEESMTETLTLNQYTMRVAMVLGSKGCEFDDVRELIDTFGENVEDGFCRRTAIDEVADTLYTFYKY